MRLDRVTITGAGDEVSVGALADLSLEFPFVEWGILLSSKRAGEPRYPGGAWIGSLVRAIQRQPGEYFGQLSGHLCGELSRFAYEDGELDCLHGLEKAFRRFQLNGFKVGSTTVDALERFMGTVARSEVMYSRPRVEIILQANNDTAPVFAVVARRLSDDDGRMVSILDDSSMGRGLAPEGARTLPPSGVQMGYAGGITRENVESVLVKISGLDGGGQKPFWIDLESGARDEEGRFDLGRVRDILRKAKPWTIWA
jgi:hypothetical protein